MPPKKATSKDQFMAAAIGDLQWLKQSLKEENVVSALDKNGLGSVHLAALHGRLNCLKYLLEERNVNVNCVSSTGWRPIHLCISSDTGKRAIACLHYLLEKGADPSVKNDDGVTPAHQAASEGHLEALKLLINIGADILSRDVRGNQPIDLAKLWCHKECARLLRNATWHQGKNQEEKQEMKKKKEKLWNALTDMEEELQIPKEQLYDGRVDFNDWLDSHLRVQRETTSSSWVLKEPKIQKVIPTASQPSRETSAPREASSIKEKKTFKKPTSQPHNSDPLRPWTYCGRVQSYFQKYQPNLRDLYPRDEFTLEPYEWSQPFELNPKSQNALALLQNQTNQEVLKTLAQKRVEAVKSQKPNNHRPNQPAVGPADTPLCRPGMMYRCKYICNVPKKKPIPPTDDWKLKSEAGIHLSADVHSHVFQNALQNPSLIPT